MLQYEKGDGMKKRYFVISGLINETDEELEYRKIEEEFIREYRDRIIGNNIQIIYEIDVSVVETLEVYRLIKDYVK